MKIAFLHMYLGIIDRGSEVFVDELANLLAKNHEVTIFQAGKIKGTQKYKVIKIPTKFDWKKKPSSGTFWEKVLMDYWAIKVMLFTLKIIPMILKEKFDIVIPINGAWMSFLIRITTYLYGGKMVVSGQAGMGWDDQKNLSFNPDAFIALST